VQRSALEYLVYGVARSVPRHPGELESRGVPPAAAAAEAGFADQAHLTRWFRRYYGITPGGYRGAVYPG
jgi:AraC-like DNA-binding protein